MGMIGYLAPVPAQACDAVASGRRNIDQLVPAYDDDDAAILCVEKLWHALHVLLSDGCIWDSEGGLGDLFMGGELGADDVGYGPARYHPPAAVDAFARALAALSDATLRMRFDPRELADNDVYPNIWDDDPASLWQEIVGYLTPVRATVAAASAAGDGLIVWFA
ncbi:MAG: YfbM family protein [Nannocystaceae bacterium]|nr:YfbM family protein [Nannocystaceae bacterium]